MAEAQASGRRVYRREAHRYILSLLYLAGAALFVVPAVLVHPTFALACIPWLLLAWRTFTIGIYPARDGVVVRNVLRSRRFAWNEIERFDWGDWWGFPIGGVYLRHGGFVRAFALNPPFELKQGRDKAVPQALEGLNEKLARTRGGRPSRREPPAAGPERGAQLRLDG
jgi:hypothetical protein